MRTLASIGIMAALVLAAHGCVDGDVEQDESGVDRDRDAGIDEEQPGAAGRGDGDNDDGGPTHDAGGSAGRGGGGGGAAPDAGGSDDSDTDAGERPAPNRPPVEPPDDPGPTPTPRTEVPAELIGTWLSSPIDFELWENYREGYYAGRSAVPTREAMIFYEGGDAKFYRYEFAFTAYEELIDCEGTVAFHDDGTFTFYPVAGRKRFYHSLHSENNVDRALTAEELLDPKLAGTRAYAYLGDSVPPAIRITVPSSAPYNWYKQE